MLRAVLQAFTNLFKPVHTVDYPVKEDIVLPEGFRGLIEYNAEHCIFCDKCEKACPPKSILFYQYEDGSKEYAYNPYLCIYCGECVRACPKADKALWQSEIKPLSGVKADEVSWAWSVWEKETKKSREAYAAAKKSKQPSKKER